MLIPGDHDNLVNSISGSFFKAPKTVFDVATLIFAFSPTGRRSMRECEVVKAKVRSCKGEGVKVRRCDGEARKLEGESASSQTRRSELLRTFKFVELSILQIQILL